ncbi:MAG: DUF983 domain-containing protein [Bacteroidia bacterium]|jgi:uncharacterized protein (DUF983 family)|nr:DUF983 domain-containing protein [Bacteroidia bacterium]
MCDKLTPHKGLAILQGKCPRCQSGKMFKHNAMSTGFMQMFGDCPVCQLHFEIEPGFFWGAMYVSYAITVAIMLILGIGTLILLNDPDFWVYIGIIIPAFILASPFTYRYSRILMIYLFSPIRFEEKYANK